MLGEKESERWMERGVLVRGGIAEGRCIYLGNDSHLALCGQALHAGDSDVEYCVCVRARERERDVPMVLIKLPTTACSPPTPPKPPLSPRASKVPFINS